MFDSGYKSQYIGGQKEKFVRYRIQKHIYFTVSFAMLYSILINNHCVMCSVKCVQIKAKFLT